MESNSMHRFFFKSPWGLLSVGAVLAVASVIAFFLLQNPKGNALPTFIMNPQIQDTRGVAVNSGFDLTASSNVEEAGLSAALSIEPSAEVSLVGSGKNWVVTPTSPLEKNTVYTMALKDSRGQTAQSFAFQTVSDLAVSSFYPADESTYVDLNTGIEITMNATDVDMKSAFSILPKISGKLTTKGYTTAFVPDKPLDPSAIYRITLKAGLTAPNGLVLKEDLKFSFETNDSSTGKWNYSDLKLEGNYAETFLPGDPPTIEMYAGAEADNLPFDVNLYRYPNVEAYSKEIRDRDSYNENRYGVKKEYVADTSKLEKVSSSNTPLYKRDYNLGTSYTFLPNNLEEGWYLVTVSGTYPSGRNQFVQKQIQVANSSVYLQSTDGDTLVWLNDPTTGKAVSGANVSVEEAKAKSGVEVKTPTAEGATKDDGTLRLDTGKMSDGYLSILKNGKAVYFEPVSLSSEAEQPLSEKFYSALYTDREIYQPDDVIRFWGVVSPRKADFKMPNTVEVALGTRWPFSLLYRQKVAVKADGTFEGSIKLTGLIKNYYELTVSDGSIRDHLPVTIFSEDSPRIYSRHGLRVENYTKPPYAITAETEKKWYYSNEKAKLNVKATYFDGSPVSNGKVNLTSYQIKETAPNPAVLQLDEAGFASFTGSLVSNQEKYTPSWQPNSVWYNIYSGDSEDVYINTDGQIYTVPSKIACKLDSKDPSSITISTASIDTKKLDDLWSGSSYIQPEYDKLTGAPVDVPITVVVKKWQNKKIPNGSYYDPINKVNIPKYSYERKEIIVDTIETKTVGGTLTLKDLPYKNDETGYHYFEVSFDGGVVGKVQETKYFRDIYYTGDEGRTRYTLSKYDEDNGGNRLNLKLGEALPLTLYANNRETENKGKVLYTVLQRKIIETGIFSEDQKNLTFGETYVPNVVVAGAYFDGRHIYTVSTFDANFLYDEKTLKVEVSSDQKTYRPGDKAKLTVKLSDSTGKPAAGTACVGVVDEAIFVLAPQELDIASQLYQSVFWTSPSQSASYTEYDMSKVNAETGGMGGGGGGGAPLRQEFVDTALFKSVAVDETGTATLDLDLPDNLTSWRLTAAAITPKLEGGNSYSDTIVTLPFSVRSVFTESYLDGDDISVMLKAITSGAADAPAVGEAVSYHVEILSSDGKVVQQKEVSGEIGKNSPANFGKLPAGSYSLKVNGGSKGLEDAIIQPFSVTKAGATQTFIKTGSLDEINLLTSLRYPVQLTVYDDALTPYMNGISAISSPSGERTEQLAAAYKARVSYNNFLPADQQITVSKDARLELIQAEDGGIKLLPASQSSAQTTGKLLLTAPDLIADRGQAVAYLQKIVGNPAVPPSDQVMAYAGLAAEKLPVLLDVKRIAMGGSPTPSVGDSAASAQKSASLALSPADRLYLAAGLAKAGDQAGAAEVYKTFANLRKTNEKQVYYESADKADGLTLNAAALMVASMIKSPDADGLMAYLTEQYSQPVEGRETMADLEMLAYLNNYTLPEGGGKATFTCQQNGKVQTLPVGNFGVTSLSLNAEDFTAGKLKAASGKISASLRYVGYSDTAPADSSGKVSIKKTIQPVGGSPLALNGMVKVVLNVHFSDEVPAGYYEISDLLPSGLRYLDTSGSGNRFEDANLWTMGQHEGQQVSAFLSYDPNPPAEGDGSPEPYPIARNPETDGALASAAAVSPGGSVIAKEAPKRDFTFVYYASCNLPGEFISPSAYISSVENGLTASSKSEKITIPGIK